MKKLIVLALVVLGLLAIVPAMELQSSTQVFSRVGMAEGDGAAASRTVIRPSGTDSSSSFDK